MGYRLGLDLGTNSIGWCLLDLNDKGQPEATLGGGARIFSDGRHPKDGTSLAAKRRHARQMRRRRDRYVARRERFIEALVRHRLMPPDQQARKALEQLDPYSLRARGLKGRLEPCELGRALFHLNQRRGFKSNRIADEADEKERGRIRSAIEDTRARLAAAGFETVGAYLADRNRRREGTRARLTGTGRKDPYALYVHRDMIAHEFDTLWERQRRHNPEVLTDAARDELRDILLYQRDLLPVDPGPCTLDPRERRAPVALPGSQRRRILEELNHLRVIDADHRSRPLTLDERNTLAQLLRTREKLTFAGMRKELRLPREVAFQAGTERRDFFKGDETAARLRKEDRFGEAWDRLSLDEQTEVVEKLLSEVDEGAVEAWLRERWGLPAGRSAAVARMRLPQGYGRFGRTATAKVVAALEANVIPASEAVERAGYDAHIRSNGTAEELPYYGEVLTRYVAPAPRAKNAAEREHGRIANPTVHIALNQLRKVVNAVMARYGRPDEIVVELARELKQSQRQKDEYEKRRKENEARNERHNRLLIEHHQEANGENRLRLRLWEELNADDPMDRRCVYTGKQINIATLFSGTVEVDHLLPFSLSLDDGIGNKVLCLRQANRDKGRQTPYQAFGHSPGEYEWGDISARAEALPENKRWRFAPDAMEQFEARANFLERHLNDTRYLSKVARAYLSVVCPPERVWVTPGRLTQMLRGKWGLNKILGKEEAKNRNDHRHHLIDAAVVGVTDHWLLNRMARAASQAEDRGAGRVLEHLPAPWPNFKDDLEILAGRCMVSHKPDHGAEGALHNDTAYGMVSGPDHRGAYTVRHRVMLSSLKGPKDLDKVAPPRLRAQIKDALSGYNETDFRRTIARFSEETGIRRVRVEEVLSVFPVRNKEGYSYKWLKGDSNYCAEIVRESNGAWKIELIPTFRANQPDFQEFLRDRAHCFQRSFSGKPLIMRLCKDDTLAIGTEQSRRILLVTELNEKRLVLIRPNEGGNLKMRHADTDDPFRKEFMGPSTLKKLKARRVFVDILGRVKDPGWGDARTDRGDRPGGVPPARGARVPGGARGG